MHTPRIFNMIYGMDPTNNCKIFSKQKIYNLVFFLYLLNFVLNFSLFLQSKCKNEEKNSWEFFLVFWFFFCFFFSLLLVGSDSFVKKEYWGETHFVSDEWLTSKTLAGRKKSVRENRVVISRCFFFFFFVIIKFLFMRLPKLFTQKCTWKKKKAN